MFRAGLMLIIRRYTEIGICHAFMLAGCWQDPVYFVYRVVPPDDEQ